MVRHLPSVLCSCCCSPELVKRTISTEGTASITILASTFSYTEGAPKLVPVHHTAQRRQALSFVRWITSGGLLTLGGDLSQHGQHLIVGVADDGGAPRAHVVDVLVAVHVPSVGALHLHHHNMRRKGADRQATEHRTGVWQRSGAPLSRTLSKTMGLPPTDLKARTGLLTPPGMIVCTVQQAVRR